MATKRSLDSGIEQIRKRCRKSVTLKTKLEVLRLLENGEKISTVSDLMKLAKSTIQTIRKNKKKIERFSQSTAFSCHSKLTRERSSIMEKMEIMLSSWIAENKRKNLRVGQAAIRNKAKKIFEELQIEEPSTNITFLASNGWLEKFKRRHSLQGIKMNREATKSDIDAAKNYVKILKSVIQKGGYVSEQVFTVDETWLYWKRLPEKTFISREEKIASGHKVSKEKLTLLIGANAAGDFKLKPLLVYSSETPRALKNVDKKQLPVIWKSNKGAMMTRTIFEDWFTNYFCPEVKSYLRKKKLSTKILLLVDNKPEHSVNLPGLCEGIEIEFIPINITALIQPMKQGIIAIFKAIYLRRTFQQMISAETKDKSTIETFWKNYNIKKAVQNISESWNELRSTALNSAWKKIWPECIVKPNNPIPVDLIPEIYENILEIANELGFDDLKEQDLVDLLHSESSPLTAKKLVQLDMHQATEDEQCPSLLRKLTSKELGEALHHFQQGINILLKKDPDQKRSARVSLSINRSINCYQELYKEIKDKAKQQTLDMLYKLASSATNKLST